MLDMSSHHKRRQQNKVENQEESINLVAVSAAQPRAQEAQEEKAATALASAWRGHAERTSHDELDAHAPDNAHPALHDDPAKPASKFGSSKWGAVRRRSNPNTGANMVEATAKSEPKKGNPAVVGLTGFAMTTLLLQLHNLGVCEIGPVLALGIIYGGFAQLVAGFQEFQCGNNFGYSAFVSYGAFWISFGIILFLNHLGVYAASDTDIGCYLALWGVYTAIMFLVSWRIHTMMSVTFLTLMLGFFGLAIAHLVHAPWLTTLSAIDLIFCALCAWYMMLAALVEQTFGGPVLPLGRPWISDATALRLRGEKDVTLGQLVRKVAALSSTHKT